MENFQSKYAVLIFKAVELTIQKRDFRIFDELVLGKTDFKHIAQYQYLSDTFGNIENVLHAGNGWGKTEVFAKKHLFYICRHILDRSKYKTCQLALTLDQARITQDRIIKLVQESPILTNSETGESRFIKRITESNLPEIEYFNGSQTLFRTTKHKAQSIEGHEFGYIGVDEIALETEIEHIREKVVLPRIRMWKNAQVEYAATPKGKNSYYRVAESIKRAGGCVRGGSAFDNPYSNHDLWRYITRNWNQIKIDQIVYGKFVDTSTLPFAGRVEKLIDTDLDLTEHLEDGHKYYEAWDLARGQTTENDMTVGLRFDFTDKQNAFITKDWSFQLPWTEKGRENLRKEGKVYTESIESKIRKEQAKHGGKGVIDSTGIGDTLSEMVRDIMQGVDFRGAKQKLIEHAQACIDVEVVKSPYIAQLVDQMSTYQLSDKGLDTDYIMAFVVGTQKLDIIKETVVNYSYDKMFIKKELSKNEGGNIKQKMFKQKTNLF